LNVVKHRSINLNYTMCKIFVILEQIQNPISKIYNVN